MKRYLYYMYKPKIKIRSKITEPEEPAEQEQTAYEHWKELIEENQKPEAERPKPFIDDLGNFGYRTVSSINTFNSFKPKKR